MTNIEPIYGTLEKTIDEQMEESKARGDEQIHAMIRPWLNSFPIEGTVTIDGEKEPYAVGICGGGGIEVRFRKRDVWYPFKEIIIQAVETVIEAGVEKPE